MAHQPRAEAQPRGLGVHGQVVQVQRIGRVGHFELPVQRRQLAHHRRVARQIGPHAAPVFHHPACVRRGRKASRDQRAVLHEPRAVAGQLDRQHCVEVVRAHDAHEEILRSFQGVPAAFQPCTPGIGDAGDDGTVGVASGSGAAAVAAITIVGTASGSEAFFSSSRITNSRSLRTPPANRGLAT